MYGFRLGPPTSRPRQGPRRRMSSVLYSPMRIRRRRCRRALAAHRANGVGGVEALGGRRVGHAHARPCRRRLRPARAGGHPRFPTTTAGFKALLRFLRFHGQLAAVGIEGTGCWGGGRARFLAARDVPVIEVDRPNRPARRRHGQGRHHRRRGSRPLRGHRPRHSEDRHRTGRDGPPAAAWPHARRSNSAPWRCCSCQRWPTPPSTSCATASSR
jgi:hypothetical protein